MWLLVPLPFNLDTQVILKLQSLSSRISSNILDMWGVLHLMAGNTLQLPDKQFFVDEACSGIVSVMSVIACGLIWAVWQNRSLPHMGLLILCGIGWAVSLNVARICIITFSHAWWQIDLSSGTPHEILGLCLFVVTFVALISTDKVLEFVLQPIETDIMGHTPEARNPLVRLRSDGLALIVWDSEADIKIGGQQIGGQTKGVAIVHKINGVWKVEFDSLTPIMPMPEEEK